MPIRLHVEDPALLGRAIELTARETGFSLRLVEKDYFCSVALEYLAANCPALIFKGGTCLSKIHIGFHRLSEDLDFAISTATASTRGQRSRSVAPTSTARIAASSRPSRITSAIGSAGRERLRLQHGDVRPAGDPGPDV